MFVRSRKHRFESELNHLEMFLLLLLLLLLPRLIGFEIDRGGGSSRQGWRKERCQPWTAVCAARWSDQSQNAAGTHRADYPQKTFCFVFGLFKNEGLPQGMSCLLNE
jgi:hypothetical protein